MARTFHGTLTHIFPIMDHSSTQISSFTPPINIKYLEWENRAFSSFANIYETCPIFLQNSYSARFALKEWSRDGKCWRLRGHCYWSENFAAKTKGHAGVTVRLGLTSLEPKLLRPESHHPSGFQLPSSRTILSITARRCPTTLSARHQVYAQQERHESSII